MNKRKPQPAAKPRVCQICHKSIDETGLDRRHRLGSDEDGVIICSSCDFSLEHEGSY